MKPSCSECSLQATSSCTCQTYPILFCPAHLLTHVASIKQQHSLMALSLNDLCSNCSKYNSDFICECKANSYPLCKFCIIPHINKSPYSSHLFKQLSIS